MKKIFLILTGVFGFYLSYGQKAVSNSNASKATVTSGVANPTINGKPYSQYKAEQDALKIQNTSKANTLKPVGDDPINSKVAVPVNKTTNAQKPNVLSEGENRKPIPVTNPVDVVKADETKGATTTISTPFPKGNGTVLKEQTPQQINTKGTSLDPNGKPIETAPTVTVKDVKPVVSEVKTEKSTLPPVAVPVSAGSKGN